MPLHESDFLGLIEAALREDIGHGDLTAELLVPQDLEGRLSMVAREAMTLAGVGVAARTFAMLDPAIAIDIHQVDGEAIAAGTAILTVSGNARAILAAERSALNFLGHLSGVATLTRRYVEAIAGTGAILLDTRKTLPGFRMLDKHAVRMGGGRNHRLRLDDGVLIKDNHIALCGGVAQAIARARDAAPAMTRIEVECDRLDQVAEALAAGADLLLLDNMEQDRLRQAVAMNSGRAKLEASGNVTLETIRAIAKTGVDFISVGRITHSAPQVDIGLDHRLGEVSGA